MMLYMVDYFFGVERLYVEEEFCVFIEWFINVMSKFICCLVIFGYFGISMKKVRYDFGKVNVVSFDNLSFVYDFFCCLNVD